MLFFVIMNIQKIEDEYNIISKKPEGIKIINDIKAIYAKAKPHEIRDMIAKHFSPSENERKKNAEIPTPPSLVDEMLDKMPSEFWTKPQKVFEPCCGKGNFVIAIFDRFYKGLEPLIEDAVERGKVIMTQCIYFADCNAMNVFITTEIMKHHIVYYIEMDEKNKLIKQLNGLQKVTDVLTEIIGSQGSYFKPITENKQKTQKTKVSLKSKN